MVLLLILSLGTHLVLLLLVLLMLILLRVFMLHLLRSTSSRCSLSLIMVVVQVLSLFSCSSIQILLRLLVKQSIPLRYLIGNPIRFLKHLHSLLILIQEITTLDIPLILKVQLTSSLSRSRLRCIMILMSSLLQLLLMKFIQMKMYSLLLIVSSVTISMEHIILV